jgi:hypothetical protein
MSCEMSLFNRKVREELRDVRKALRTFSVSKIQRDEKTLRLCVFVAINL